MKKKLRQRPDQDPEELLKQKMNELEEMQNFMSLSESFLYPPALLESVVQELEKKQKSDPILLVLPKKKKCLLF